ncbi:RagB/SusD family nutrient uptake outer membrane protein [Chitinophaga horti]|uniref:RagB/SusD family nutrient uptake outer membrane protein n=1 Tax=Chitinophaga horti TaxID=2920382 RepID=A0ABY6IZ58_9BACT|nr:RagB/SusD family nutrient uptake outer membrane protein [Chitinophaga horti]UYQ91687.1 RagB/SusD family nutrient uptake outer membrane protein [Chitinophaga horti]
MNKAFKYILSGMMLASVSCSKDFLDEKPVSFLSSSNGLVTYADFNAAVNDLYRVVRMEFYTRDENYPFDYLYSTDLVFDGQPNTRRHTNLVATFAPSGGNNVPLTHWSTLYKIVAQANTIISRTPGASLTDAQKTLLIAKAKFFRAFGYRTLGYLFGGVPLSLEDVTTPKTDYVRATRAEVYAQCIADLKDAVAGLPAINTVLDGEISAQAAGHLLAEVYLAAGENQNAVDAATAVISNANVGLMKNRFGTGANNAAGNVYWDLFQPGNQNRKSGNTEGLWVIQMETDIPGGSAVSTAQAGSYLLERHHAPYVGSLLSNGRNPFLWPVSNSSGGRGIGWAVSTKHFSDDIWQSDFNNDIRNANINFVRVFTANNPASPLNGQPINTSAPPPGITVPSRGFYAYQAKSTTPGQHPANLIQNATTGLLKATAGGTYTDQYMFRLAETYLIRAEAYMKLNQPGNAVLDLNAVRSRSNATGVQEAAVNIDYILDERMRELGVEEKRMLTLTRLGLRYDRVKRFNPYYSDITTTYNLWPIPADEIERNKDAVLDQNDGYN